MSHHSVSLPVITGCFLPALPRQPPDASGVPAAPRGAAPPSHGRSDPGTGELPERSAPHHRPRTTEKKTLLASKLPGPSLSLAPGSGRSSGLGPALVYGPPPTPGSSRLGEHRAREPRLPPSRRPQGRAPRRGQTRGARYGPVQPRTARYGPAPGG